MDKAKEMYDNALRINDKFDIARVRLNKLIGLEQIEENK